MNPFWLNAISQLFKAPKNHKEQMYMNPEIYVTSVYFPSGNTKRGFPRRIEFLDTGKQLNFIDGLRVLVKKGQEFIEIFTMTDGHTTYRLKHSPKEQEWELIGTGDPKESRH